MERRLGLAGTYEMQSPETKDAGSKNEKRWKDEGLKVNGGKNDKGRGKEGD